MDARLFAHHSGVRVKRANPESRSNDFANHFEIPDRSAWRTVRNDGKR